MNSIPYSKNLRDAALGYAVRGWAVFPLRGKLPSISKGDGGHGYLDASTNIQQITKWWSQYPRANVGIASRASGLIIIDVDPRKGGDKHLLDLELQYGRVPDTAEVITGAGGRHIYLVAPANDRVQRKTDALGKGIDLPNYAVAPPSIHPGTRQPYLWEASSHPDDVPLAPCPNWVLRLTEKRPPASRIYQPVDDGGVSWEQILVPHGWVPIYQRGKVTYWRRPGKNDGWSATTEYIPGRLYLFTTDGAPLAAGRPYSKVGAYAALNHVSYKMAARGLEVVLPYHMTWLGLKPLSAARAPAPPVFRRLP